MKIGWDLIEMNYGEYKKWIVSTIRSMNIPNQDQDDLIQDVILRLFNSLELPEVKNPQGFIAVITRNIIYDYFRKINRDAPFRKTILSEDLLIDENHPNLEVYNLIKKTVISSRISKENVEPFILHHVFGFSYPEISEMLSLPLERLKKRARKAQEQLNSFFNRRRNY